MCSLGVSNRGKDWVPLEVSHKGQRHKISRMGQESQQDAESGMRVEFFV